MQKLQVKLKNVPVDASQVHCSTTRLLNREKTPYPLIGAQCNLEIRTCNDLEVNQVVW